MAEKHPSVKWQNLALFLIVSIDFYPPLEAERRKRPLAKGWQQD